MDSRTYSSPQNSNSMDWGEIVANQNPEEIHTLFVNAEDKLKSEQSFFEFFKLARKVLEPEIEYIDNWHIKYICDILEEETHRIGNKRPKKEDLIINIPPRNYKSMIVTVCWNAWAWIHYPFLKFITTSHNRELANKHSVDTRDIIRSKWYQDKWSHIFQLSEDQDVKSNFTNDKKGSRLAASVGSGITGHGGDILVCLKGDQKIYTDQGEIEIETIVKNKLQVKVASYNHDYENIEFKKILKYEENPGSKLMEIEIGNKKIKCTENHPFYIHGKGYVLAKNLEINDVVETMDINCTGCNKILNKRPSQVKLYKKLKEEVRERDNQTCQICGKSKIENGKNLDVHHIDYNKENINIDNLIALCASCHVKTNSNREIWQKELSKKLHI